MSESDAKVDMTDRSAEHTVLGGDWALISLQEELTDRATYVANSLGMHIEDFIERALEEKLERMGLRQGPVRERHNW